MDGGRAGADKSASGIVGVVPVLVLRSGERVDLALATGRHDVIAPAFAKLLRARDGVPPRGLETAASIVEAGDHKLSLAA